MSYEFGGVEEALEYLANEEAIGSPFFEECMHFVAILLGNEFLGYIDNGDDEKAHTVRLITSSEDYDLLAAPFAQHVRSFGHSVAISCLWSVLDRGNEYIPDTSRLLSQVHEVGPLTTDFTIHISSGMDEIAVIADHLSRASGKISASSNLVLCPLISEQDKEDMRLQMHMRGRKLPLQFLTISGLAYRHATILEWVRTHLRAVTGQHGLGHLPVDFGGTAVKYVKSFDPPPVNGLGR